MKDMVDIEVIIDEKYVDPKVAIHTKRKTEQIDNIIYAIENVSGSDFPAIPAFMGERIELLSQRDIFRVYTQGRKVVVQTEKESFTVRKTLSGLEEDLNPKRFLRISQSEIINLYKIKCFDITLAGTIGITFDNGIQSWASRSRVKAVKDMIRELEEERRQL
ncbi:MAG: LytTR family transcriptional regulator [Lachnospiraceae bacterium]|nr:LytTR family transcriptional regulator [Lachnospiraceae bacterium]